MEIVVVCKLCEEMREVLRTYIGLDESTCSLFLEAVEEDRRLVLWPIADVREE